MLLISISSVLILFVISTVVVIVVALDNGWPKVSIMKMAAREMTNCLSAIFGCYFVLLFISCLFYFLILWRQSKLGKSSVGLLDNQEIWTGSGLEPRASGLRATDDHWPSSQDQHCMSSSAGEQESSLSVVKNQPEDTGSSAKTGRSF